MASNRGSEPEFCRYRSEADYSMCGEPAEFIVWGKLFPADALGPRCYRHARIHVDAFTLGAASDRGYGVAIYYLGRPEAVTPC